MSEETQTKTYRTILTEYRNSLTLSNQKVLEGYDKLILTLSGGALGLSMTFIKDVIGTDPMQLPNLLFLSWLCWTLSLTASIFSYYLSHYMHERYIEKTDEELEKEEPGKPDMSDIKKWVNILRLLNIFSGLVLNIGFLLMGIFVWNNI